MFVYAKNTSRRKKNKKSAKLLAAEAEHKAFLASYGLIGVSSSGRTPVSETVNVGSNPASPAKLAPLSNTIPTGTFAKPDQKVYSGEQKLIGIAVMHKSNLVPVFSKKDAVDIAKMRRG